MVDGMGMPYGSPGGAPAELGRLGRQSPLLRPRDEATFDRILAGAATGYRLHSIHRVTEGLGNG
jgi:hypothetical protein